MAHPWDAARERIDAQVFTSSSWLSDRRHLHKIIDAAEEWHIKDGFKGLTCLSNLRAIVPRARRAVWGKDRAELERVLQWASSLSNKDLRIQIGTTMREEIAVHVKTDSRKEVYVVRLTREQYGEIEKASRHKYAFVVAK